MKRRVETVFCRISYGSALTMLTVLTATNALDSCWDPFDQQLRQQCGTGEWLQRYYYDAAAGRCRLFWWDGCRSGASRNFFTDLLNCQWLCEQTDAPATLVTPSYHPQHPHRHHQLSHSHSQSPAVAGGGTEIQTEIKSFVSTPQMTNVCYDHFDEHYRDECDGGDWRTFYYFDKYSRKCVAFWYDGCRGESANLFADESACIRFCEQPALQLTHLQHKSMPTTPSTTTTTMALWRQKFPPKTTAIVMRATITTIRSTSTLTSTTIEAKSMPKVTTKSPTRKNRPGAAAAAALFAAKYAKDAKGVVSTKLPADSKSRTTRPALFALKKTSPEDSDASRSAASVTFATLVEGGCTLAACQNGGSCEQRLSGTGNDTEWHECFCAKGYAGNSCELKPCDNDPCRNNGTCRTTRGQAPFFFCECQPDWGGKTCIIPIPSTRARKYGKNVQLLSSGRPEWIEQIQRLNSLNASRSNNDSALELGSSSSLVSSPTPPTPNTTADVVQHDPPSGGFLPIHVDESPTRTLSRDPTAAMGSSRAVRPISPASLISLGYNLICTAIIIFAGSAVSAQNSYAHLVI